MKNIALLNILVFVLIGHAFGQKELKKISTDDYEIWENLSRQNISNDGQWVTYQVDKIKEEDGYLVIYNAKNKAEKKIPRGYNAQIASNSSFVVFKIAPEFDKVRELKLKKSKKSELPNDSLGIYLTEKDSLIKIADVKDYNLATESGDWLTYSISSRKIKISKESDENIWQKLWSKNNPEYESKTIKNLVYIYNPITDSITEYIEIEDFDISYYGDVIALIQEEKADSLKKLKLYIYNTKNQQTAILLDTIAFASKINIDRKGNQLAMLFSTDTVKKNKVYSLFYANITDSNYSVIVDTNTRHLTENYSPSIYRTPYFSEDATKLYFGIAPKPELEKEDSLLDEEKYNLDIWHYKDGLLQTQQKKQAPYEARKTYTSVYHIHAKKLTVLSDSLVENIRTVNKGNSEIILGMANNHYERLISWDGWYNDIYLINSISGDRKKIIEKASANVNLSPAANFVVYYKRSDSSWYSYSVNNNKHTNITKDIEYGFYDKEHDTPQLPGSYGIVGWSKDKESVYIRDEFDIWKFNLNTNKHINLTNFYGRKNNIKFRYIKLDYEQEYIDKDDEILLRAFNTKNKKSGFYKFSFNSEAENQINRLVFSDHTYYYPDKAKNSDKIIWRKESFRAYPNLYFSDINFQSIRQISDLNLQQSDYVWGDVEQYNWEAFDGTKLNGLLYKPSNFDSTKKYPMIVYFYERYSDNLNRYYIPKPSHSTINFTEYVSNGYIIFVPDIVYKTGKPGESAYNCIISGTKKLMKENWIDTNKIGIQGQSWGGYQVAYLVGRTNMFAAAESGAPVSNMTSAYGGIRWGSGMSRAFQYEKGQSRIGVDMWSNLDLYIENSPIFFADKVETPLLIMHNTEDGAVPWSQGIEYFSALRRLGKVTWMLSYEDNHNLMKWPNRVDLNIRMRQFFDYYLKDEPMPLWMKEGLPYINKEKQDAYELVE